MSATGPTHDVAEGTVLAAGGERIGLPCGCTALKGAS